METMPEAENHFICQTSYRQTKEKQVYLNPQVDSPLFAAVVVAAAYTF